MFALKRECLRRSVRESAEGNKTNLLSPNYKHTTKYAYWSSFTLPLFRQLLFLSLNLVAMVTVRSS